MDIIEGVIFSKDNLAQYRPWKTPMERVEKILEAGHARREANKPPPIPAGFKQCGDGCQQILPATLEYFYKSKQTRLKIGYRCKICKSKRDRQKRLGDKKDTTIYLIAETHTTTTTNEATATMMENTGHYQRCTRDQYYARQYQIRDAKLKAAEVAQ